MKQLIKGDSSTCCSRETKSKLSSAKESSECIELFEGSLFLFISKSPKNALGNIKRSPSKHLLTGMNFFSASAIENAARLDAHRVDVVVLARLVILAAMFAQTKCCGRDVGKSRRWRGKGNQVKTATTLSSNFEEASGVPLTQTRLSILTG